MSKVSAAQVQDMIAATAAEVERLGEVGAVSRLEARLGRQSTREERRDLDQQIANPMHADCDNRGGACIACRQG